MKFQESRFKTDRKKYQHNMWLGTPAFKSWKTEIQREWKRNWMF